MTSRDIQAGETARRVVFYGIKYKWATKGFTPTVDIVNPKNKITTLPCYVGDCGEAECYFTTASNPFPSVGTYYVQLIFTKGSEILKGRIHKMVVKKNVKP